jgi:hypothetical protein
LLATWYILVDVGTGLEHGFIVFNETDSDDHLRASDSDSPTCTVTFMISTRSTTVNYISLSSTGARQNSVTGA